MQIFTQSLLRRACRDKILDISITRYTNFNDTHFTEKLKVIEDIAIDRDIMRRPRPKRHFKRRPHKPQEGMIALWDGSPHR